jgi:hypothetical protein
VGGGVAFGVGEFVGVGLGSLAATGVAEGVTLAVGVSVEPQADAISAVTANARIQSAVFMCLEG